MTGWCEDSWTESCRRFSPFTTARPSCGTERAQKNGTPIAYDHRAQKAEQLLASPSIESVLPASGGVQLLGIEPLEEHARRLAAVLTPARGPRGSSRAHLKRLSEHARALRDVYTALAEDIRRGEPASPAAEWLLDNFHLISATVRDIRHDVPPSFYRRLPALADDEFGLKPHVRAAGSRERRELPLSRETPVARTCRPLPATRGP